MMSSSAFGNADTGYALAYALLTALIALLQQVVRGQSCYYFRAQSARAFLAGPHLAAKLLKPRC